ncbi:MAG: LptE family protein [Blastochloris sp.]|nr:LptE family protein [Blastochloris sp.]
MITVPFLSCLLRRALPLLALTLLLGACAGYKLGNIPSADMQGVQTIYVPVAKNDSYEPGLQVLTTNAVIRQLETDGAYRSARLDQSDASLEVTITRLERSPKRVQRDNVVATQEYTLTLSAKFTLTNHSTGKKVLENVEVSGQTDYFLFNDVQEGERQALPLAVDKLAYEIVKQVTEGW